MEQTRYRFPVFKAAAVQAASVVKDSPDYFDTTATLSKAISLIEEASRNGARLIVFPEGWLPCFVYWSLDLPQKRQFMDIWAKYLWSSIIVPGPETEALCAAAKKADVYIVTGINERSAQYRGRMHNSILYISPRGEIMGIHRKICVTVNERLFHTAGDGGKNLKTVFRTDIGVLGGSICGEHSQLGLLHNWIVQGVEVHCSIWPGTLDTEVSVDTKSRSLCRSAGIFAVAAAAYMPESAKPKNFYANSEFSLPGSFRGGSGIIDPWGNYIAGPVYDTESIVYGEINLADIDRARATLNLVGQYSRWDILRVSVNEEPYEPLAPMSLRNGSQTSQETDNRISMLEQQIVALEEALSKKEA